MAGSPGAAFRIRTAAGSAMKPGLFTGLGPIDPRSRVGQTPARFNTVLQAVGIRFAGHWVAHLRQRPVHPGRATRTTRMTRPKSAFRAGQARVDHGQPDEPTSVTELVKL
jgi:hypothetical protein